MTNGAARSPAQEPDAADEPSSSLYVETGNAASFVDRLAWLGREKRWSEYADLCIETMAHGGEELCYVGKGQYRWLAAVALEKLKSAPSPVVAAVVQRREPAGRALLQRAVAENDEALVARVAREFVFVPAGIDAALRLARLRFESGSLPSALAEVERALSAAQEAVPTGMSPSAATLAELHAFKLLSRKLVGLSVEDMRSNGGDEPGEVHATGEKPEEKPVSPIPPYQRGLGGCLLDSLLETTIHASGEDLKLGDFLRKVFPPDDAMGRRQESVRGRTDWPTAGGDNARCSYADLDIKKPVFAWSFPVRKTAKETAREPTDSAFQLPGLVFIVPPAAAAKEPAPLFAAAGEGAVYATSGETLYAVEITTGKLLWQYGRAEKKQQAQQAERGRMYYPAGCTLADGKVIATLGRSASDRSSLVACDTRSKGQFAWSLEAREVAPGERLVFLGPPVVALGRVYLPGLALSGQETGVYLICVSARSGKLLWKRFVCSRTLMDNRFGNQPAMYTTNAWNTAVSECHGTIVVGTQLGAIAAIDGASGEIKWLWDIGEVAARHSRTKRQPSDDINRAATGQGSSLAFPIVKDGVCYYLHTWENLLFGIELVTGKMALCKRMTGVTQVEGLLGDAIITTGRTVEAYELPSCAKLWGPAAKLLPATGRGLVTASSQFIAPTTEGLLSFDVPTGKLLCSTRWEPNGAACGNVLAADGALLVSEENSVRCYMDWQRLSAGFEEKLARTPPEVRAYVDRAEILAGNGYYEEAMDDLEAFLKSPDAAGADKLQAIGEADRKKAADRLVLLSLTLGLQCSEKGNRSGAIEALKRGLAAADDSPRQSALLRQLVIELLRDLKWQDACDLAVRLAQRSPDAEIEVSPGYAMPAWNFAAARLAEAVEIGRQDAVAHLETLADKCETSMSLLQFCSMFGPTAAAFSRLERNWADKSEKGDLVGAVAAATLWLRMCPEAGRAPKAIAALADGLAKLGDRARLKALLDVCRELYPEALVPPDYGQSGLCAHVEQVLKNCAATENKDARGAPSGGFPGSLVTNLELKEGKQKTVPAAFNQIFIPGGLAPPGGKTAMVVARLGRIEYWSLAEGQCLWVTPTGSAGNSIMAVGFASPDSLVAASEGKVLCVETTTGRLLWEYRLASQSGSGLAQASLAFARGVVVVEARYGDVLSLRDARGRAVVPCSLIALDVRTGSLLWRHDREDSVPLRRGGETEGTGMRQPTMTVDGLAASEMGQFVLCLMPRVPGGMLQVYQAWKRQGGIVVQATETAFLDVRYGSLRDSANRRPAIPLSEDEQNQSADVGASLFLECPDETLTHLAFQAVSTRVVAWNLAKADKEWSLQLRQQPAYLACLAIENGVLAVGSGADISLYDVQTQKRLMMAEQMDSGWRLIGVYVVDRAKRLLAVAYASQNLPAVQVVVYKFTGAGLEQVWASREKSIDFLARMNTVEVVSGIPDTVVLCSRQNGTRVVDRNGKRFTTVAWVSLALNTSTWKVVWSHEHELNTVSQSGCPWRNVLEGFRIVDTIDGCKVYW